MWNPAVPGMEDAHICAVLSFRRIRRYPVLPFKTAEKHVTLVMWGSPAYAACFAGSEGPGQLGLFYSSGRKDRDAFFGGTCPDPEGF